MDMGAPVSLDELYEVAGFRKPERTEVVIVKSGDGGVDAFGNPLPASTQIVDPKADAQRDADDAAAQSGGLEAGGADQAKDNAVDDLNLEQGQPAHAIAISDNHGHDFMTPLAGEAAYPIQGGADHNHMIQVTAGHLEAIATGVAVVIQSAPGPDGHVHEVTIQAMGEFNVQGLTELLRAGGVELDTSALEFVATMAPEARETVVAALMADAVAGDPR